jgi:type IV secretory pathway TraG/TraD family ATPase VirD4
MLPVLQDLPQLKGLYPERWETILGMAGVVQTFRAGDLTTAEWVSKRSPTTTDTVLGFNQGTGHAASGSSKNMGSSTNQIERPTIRPHDMFELPDENTVVFFAGKKNPARLHMPHFTDLPHLKTRALKNPYWHG